MSARSGDIKVILPTPLLSGGTIGICAPAGPVIPDRLKKAVSALKTDGFGVEMSASAMSKNGLFSATDSIRRRELEQMFSRSDIDAVFCARGGVGSSRLLSHLNTHSIARSRKPFLGFSDITVLQWLLWARERLVTFSGPLGIEWNTVSERTRRQTLRVLDGSAAPDLLADFPREPIHILRKGRKVIGRLMPGNLTMIATLLGTSFLPDLRGTLLLVEDVNEPPHRVDRLLFHLRNTGVLSSISALLIGELGGEEDEETVRRSLRDAVRGETYPVVIGLPYGHGKERMALPVGGLVEFDPSLVKLSLVEPVVREPR